MKCPYCLEKLPSSGTCRSCGESIPTDGVPEPAAGSLWVNVARLGGVLVPVISLLIFLVPAQKWLKPATEIVRKAIDSRGDPTPVRIGKRSVAEGVRPPRPIDLPSIERSELGPEGRRLIFEIVVDKEGRAAFHRMIEGSASQALLDAVSVWEFEPARDAEGDAVSSIVGVTLDLGTNGRVDAFRIGG